MLFCPFGIYWLMPNRALDFYLVGRDDLAGIGI